MMSTVNYVLVGILFASWVALFALKDFTADSEARAEDLQAQIIAEQNEIRTLMTDWAVLNEPGYLQDLARMHLGLGTLSSGQIVRMTALPMAPLDGRRAERGTMQASALGNVQFPGGMLSSPRLDRIAAAEAFAAWPQPSIRPTLEQGSGE